MVTVFWAQTNLKNAFGYRPLPKNTFDSFIQREQLPKDQIAYPSNPGNLLLMAPDQINLYTLDIPRSAYPVSDDTLRQKTVFQLESLTPILHRDKKTDFFLRLKPLRMTVENKQGVIEKRDLTEVSKLKGKFVQAENASAAPAPASVKGPLSLSPALLDVMMANALGNQLPESALAAAVARRWHFEQTPVTLFGNPFFIKGRRAPESKDLPQLGQQFKAWAASALPDTPWELKFAINHAANYGWRGIECTAHVVILNLNDRSIRLPGRSKASYEIRKENEARDHSNFNALVRERRSSALQIEFDQKPGLGRSLKDRVKDLQMVNFAVEVYDRYQEIGERCGLSGYDSDNSDLASIYLYLNDALPPAPNVNNSTANQAEAVIEITGVRMVSAEPHFSDLLPPEFVRKRKLAPLSRDRQAIILDAKLKEITYYSDRGKTRFEPQLPDPGQSVQSLLAAAQAEPEMLKYKTPEGPYGWDIVGLQLGMKMTDAENTIRKHMKVGRVLEGKRLYDGSAQSGRVTPASSGKLFISEDQREFIAIIDEPPAAAGKVLAVWRRVYMPGNTVSENEVIGALRTKYGNPPGTEVGRLDNRWHTPDGYRCEFRSKELPLSINWTENDKPVEMKQDDNKLMPDGRLPEPYHDPLNPNYENAERCGPIMTAWIQFQSPDLFQPERNQSMNWVEQTLTDIGPYMQAFRANGKTVQAAGSKGLASDALKF